MDSYLKIAETVLRAAKRPMSAKAILDSAYKADIAPTHLRGKTQHKTLQARLSEDILLNRSDSRFFRTEPGLFFLSEYLSDPKIPDKFKHPFPARRRTRDLQKELPLAIKRNIWSNFKDKNNILFKDLIRKAKDSDSISYLNSSNVDSEFDCVWTFSLVRRKESVLSYRIGRYRDDRDDFLNKRTIGFPGAITYSDSTLFTQDDFGATENALSAILTDLDLSRMAFETDTLEEPKPISIIRTEDTKLKPAILLIMEWECPDWFEPTTKRLSLNSPSWLDLRVAPNNLEDFEPWSIATIERMFKSCTFK